jgi:hypothetical protein
VNARVRTRQGDQCTSAPRHGGRSYGPRNLPIDGCIVPAESARHRTAVVSFPIGKQSAVGDFAPKREGISTSPSGPDSCRVAVGGLGRSVSWTGIDSGRLCTSSFPADSTVSEAKVRFPSFHLPTLVYEGGQAGNSPPGAQDTGSSCCWISSLGGTAFSFRRGGRYDAFAVGTG